MRRLAAALVAMSLGLPAIAQDAALRRLDAELAAIAGDAEHPLASLSVAAIRNGEVVYQRQFGHRFIGASPSTSLPANEATLYRIASITKLVTTLAVMRLAERGALSLDEDIGKYLGYTLRNPHHPGTPITLRSLLSHTSSLRDDGGYVFGPGDDLREFLVPGGKMHAQGAMWSAKAPPGEYFSYCNLGWVVIGTVLEKVANERFDRLMARLVLEPLGMKGGFNPAEMSADTVGNLATIYRKATAGDTQVWNPGGPWIPQVDDYSKGAPANRAGPDYVLGTNGGLFGPQGNLRASVADLARVMRMLMARGRIDGRRFLEEGTVEAMFARQWKSDGGGNGDTSFGPDQELFQAWGLGNQQFVGVGGPARGARLVEDGSFTAVGHLGDAYGLHGGFLMDRERRNGVIYLAGGTGFDPATDPGRYSALHRYAERIITAVHRRAVLGRSD